MKPAKDRPKTEQVYPSLELDKEMLHIADIASVRWHEEAFYLRDKRNLEMALYYDIGIIGLKIRYSVPENLLRI
jgi:hypothetical protein